MTSELVIFRQEFSYPEDNEGRMVMKQIEICESINDTEIIDKIIDVCRKHWHLEGECGFIGECDGAELAEIIGRGLDDCDNKVKHDEISNSDEYRIEVSW